ncbi:MAG: DUF692 family protein [Nitrospirae bacterium]|nr:DUF692 family protein [Nitrospirota bacterium]MBI3595206.1 DUF692 family protein [Nitrospirota bacterium]
MKTQSEKYIQLIQSIPFHGIGLSVDLHVPDLFELISRLNHAGLAFDYLEVFRGPVSLLAPVRKVIQKIHPLEYHADSLWFTQPEFFQTPWEKECRKIIQDTSILKSHWVTHECATKEIFGNFFGTYLPPLLTRMSGELIGRQSAFIQDYLFSHWEDQDVLPPLLLIEIPPFYSFAVGDLTLSHFFRIISEHSPCGFLLDIGHLYTYFLSSGLKHRILFESFIETFLDEFPLERVVQIHLGGLKVYHQGYQDHHGSPVPELLFEFLPLLLGDSRLAYLKGIALEVDTKEIDLILTEYARFQSLGAKWLDLRKVPD